jgi:hypothetical protein
MQLKVLVDTFKNTITPEENNPQQKCARSILSKLILKIKKKQLDELQKTDIFSSKKKIKISMEYHQAYYLQDFLIAVNYVNLDQYERNVVSIIITDLNQKLI